MLNPNVMRHRRDFMVSALGAMVVILMVINGVGRSDASPLVSTSVDLVQNQVFVHLLRAADSQGLRLQPRPLL